MTQRPRNGRRWRHALPVLLLAAGGVPATAAATCPGLAVPDVGFIDADAHIPADATAGALAVMDRAGIAATVTMPLPAPPGPHNDRLKEQYRQAARDPSGRIAYVGGGAILNAMIQEATRAANLTDVLEARFAQAAEKLLADGACGFGEMAVLSLSLSGSQQPYESAPADHPLFLMLADIAARHGVPMVLHMEAVPEAMAIPNVIAGAPNPDRLQANIEAFEALLVHNPDTRIIWAHAGWDNTGKRTVELMRRLLDAHANLFMTVKVDRKGRIQTRPVDGAGTLRPEWLGLFTDFPDRFVLGSDEPYDSNGRREVRNPFALRQLLDQLPADLARQIGRDNAKKLFGL